MTETKILGVDELGMSSSPNGRVLEPVTIATDDKGKPQLPEVPRVDDRAAQATWLTAALRLGPQHPITSGQHLGELGGGGIVRLKRYDAPDLRFDPASLIGKQDALHEALVWQRAEFDEKPIAWQKKDAQTIAWVVSCLCRRSSEAATRHSADVVVTTLIATGQRVDGCTTYGTSAQRYEAGASIVPEIDQYGRIVRRRYLVDEETGEYAVRVSDAAHVARQLHGALRRGWLDGVFEEYGWQRITLEGHALPGRDGRRGPHHRSDVYRGRLPEAIDDEGSVTT